jgi:hypothetical protein
MAFTIPTAHPVTLIKACQKPQGAMSTTLYQVEDQDGIWIRVTREGRQGTFTPDPRAVVAHDGDSLIELIRWEALECLLGQARMDKVIAKRREEDLQEHCQAEAREQQEEQAQSSAEEFPAVNPRPQAPYSTVG